MLFEGPCWDGKLRASGAGPRPGAAPTAGPQEKRTPAGSTGNPLAAAGNQFLGNCLPRIGDLRIAFSWASLKHFGAGNQAFPAHP